MKNTCKLKQIYNLTNSSFNVHSNIVPSASERHFPLWLNFKSLVPRITSATTNPNTASVSRNTHVTPITASLINGETARELDEILNPLPFNLTRKRLNRFDYFKNSTAQTPKSKSLSIPTKVIKSVSVRATTASDTLSATSNPNTIAVHYALKIKASTSSAYILQCLDAFTYTVKRSKVNKSSVNLYPYICAFNNNNIKYQQGARGY